MYYTTPKAHKPFIYQYFQLFNVTSCPFPWHFLSFLPFLDTLPINFIQCHNMTCLLSYHDKLPAPHEKGLRFAQLKTLQFFVAGHLTDIFLVKKTKLSAPCKTVAFYLREPLRKFHKTTVYARFKYFHSYHTLLPSLYHTLCHIYSVFALHNLLSVIIY